MNNVRSNNVRSGNARYRITEDAKEEAKRMLLEKLQKAYENPRANSMYPLIDAVSAYATLGEIVGVGREVFGTFKEPQII